MTPNRKNEMANPVVHFDIGCRDRDATNAFYTELFGWKTEDYGPAAKRIDTRSPEGIQGFMTSLGHEPHHYVMIYVQVEDIAAHLSRVEELGGKIMVPETEVPGQGHFAWIHDLDDNIVGLWRPAS